MAATCSSQHRNLMHSRLLEMLRPLDGSTDLECFGKWPSAPAGLGASSSLSSPDDRPRTPPVDV